MPWRGTDVRPLNLRPRALRPQLKRDPLGSMPMRIQPLLLTTAMLAATATDTTYAQRPRSISGLPSWALDTVGRCHLGKTLFEALPST